MEDILLPQRMFAAGDEPLGERVNLYQKLKTTRAIINALEPDELDFIRNSTFGKIIAIEEYPIFSGAFGQYVVVRMLKVNKKYEVWFLFAGNPIRMSLREFAIVTGLNCGKIPEPSKKKKNPLKQKLYLNELFGSLKFCTVKTAVEMLKNKVHVELIRDLDEFLAFPWGRAAYHTLITSLISKDELALSQTSVAIRGYVDAIKLVLLAAIPQLKEEITEAATPVVIKDSESEGETPDEATASEDGNVVEQEKPSLATNYVIIPGHAKSVDTDCQVPVKNILDDPFEEWSAGLDFLLGDESEDPAVDNMVRLISDGFEFRKEMFRGGLNANDLSQGDNIRTPPSDIRDEIASLENRICQAIDVKLENLFSPTSQSQLVALIQSTITRCLQDTDKKIGDAIARQIKDMQAAIIKGLTGVTGETRPSPYSSAENATKNIPADHVYVSSITAPPVIASNPPVPDYNTLSEAVDHRIVDVLRDLNVVHDVPHTAHTDADAPRHMADHTEEQSDHTGPFEQANI
ncbi:hypothetical protein Bca52824_028541 [Brassica carinata]|uniref:DUF1985 domain-containing protein n=1 Tax=Brassica carinata TaxID=52824 RepID=A0A8X7VCE6_BRACI|nr:hypothetical protein Bca52824_028541 [Brassica carinata]